MFFCSQCGEELVGKRKFCKCCGTKVIQTNNAILGEKILPITDSENQEIIDLPLVDSLKIITDEPTKDATDFKKYSDQLSKLIVDSTPRFTVGIYGGWGTGKTTLMQMMQNEIKEKYSDNVEVVWFDAWRYEKEEHSAMLPLLRTIILSLKDAKERSIDGKKKKILLGLEKKVTKIFESILRNTNLSLEGGSLSAKVGANLDIGKIMDEYRSDGSFFQNQERIYFHEHITDHLKEELKKIRQDVYNIDFRIVIFIDDLDRCTPERALELLESIKTFFDIEGIIYVIGMDPQTIDPIINTKYGKNSKIDGMIYLQKIVQLPFQIPLWGSLDLSKTIKDLVKETGLSEDYSNGILEEEELIMNATQFNPRDIKRFINSIVLAKKFYGQDIDDIDKIIATQAFYFHGYKWIDFLKLLISYDKRRHFLMHFILLLELHSQEITSLNDLTKIIKVNDDKEIKNRNDHYHPHTSLIETFKKDNLLNYVCSKLIEIDDNTLFGFLKIASKPLLKIDKIENYLKIADSAGLTIKSKDAREINSKKQLEYLKNDKVEEFNDYYNENKHILIHLPYAELQGHKLDRRINLRYSFLFKANLSGADLTNANLTNANLTKANLTNARLRKANLTGANLYWADLTNADLTKARLTNANLSYANLYWANLTNANLSYANLYWANLSDADLTNADLTNTDLSYANLYWANLSDADLTNADLTNTDLTFANLSGADLTNADFENSIIINNIYSEKTILLDSNFKNAIIDNYEFLEYLLKNKAKNIPKEKIGNKKELKSQLEIRKLDQSLITELLHISKLPST